MRQKIIFIITMMLALAAGQLRAETETNMPYVIYDSGNKTLYFLCNTGNPLAVNSNVTVGENTTITIADGCLWSGEAVTNIRNFSEPGWNSKSSEATKVVFEPSFAYAKVKSCYGWFSGFMYLETVTGLEYLNTSNVTNMDSMFSTCRSLTSLDLSSFNTSSVTDMGSMFSNCFNLASLDLSSFNTSSVTDMDHMFSYCSSLTSLDLSSFNIAQERSHCRMNYMFDNCGSLSSLVFGQLNTSNVTNMNNMFDNCISLRLVDLSKATGDKIPDMIGKLPADNDPVIFVPSGTTLTGDIKNVISGDGGRCDKLVIDADKLPSLSFPYSFTAEKIEFRRTFEADKPHTLYLPFAIDATAYGTFYTFTRYDNANQKVIFSKITVDKTVANTPYLFVPKNTVWNIEITAENGIAVSKTTDETTDATQPQPETGLIGVYKKHTFDDTNKANCYGWADDKFMRAGSGASVGACRAYLKLAADGGSLAPARLSISLDGDGTTGITAVKGGADGDTDAPMYNLQGQRVDKSYRGVVIKNGKKMIIK